MNNLSPFEKEIRQTYHLPDASPALFDRLEARLQAYQPKPETKAKLTLPFARGWAYAMAAILFTGLLVLAIGPSKVLAQIQAAFGFVPDAGLVDTSLPFKQLAEPVIDTKDGITLTIQSAFLSADQMIIAYTISDLPVEIKHAKFGDPECLTPAYLILPDGSKIDASESSGALTPDDSFVHNLRFSSSIPASFEQATLVFPCLEGTARGKGPKDWQIALAFKPAPADIVIYPATLLPSQAKTEAPAMPALIVNGDRREEMVVLAVVEKPESYWVTWAYPDKMDENIQINGQRYIAPFNPVLYDANGMELPEPDHDTQLELWKYEDSLRSQLSGQEGMKYAGSLHTFVVPKSGMVFPVYARQKVYERSFPEKEAYAEIEFDGTQVQASDAPVELNQEIQLGSVKFQLRAIEKNSYGGYSFLFDGSEGRVVQCQVDLVGHPTDMGDSSSFNPDDPFHFDQAVLYRQIPTGRLTVRISQPAVLGDLISFIGSWEPEK